MLNTGLGNLPFLKPGALTRLTTLANALSKPFEKSSFDAEKEITTFPSSLFKICDIYSSSKNTFKYYRLKYKKLLINYIVNA